MKGCKALQLIFGITCAILTVAVGLTAVMLFLPHIGVELDFEPFATMSKGVDTIAKTLDLPDHSWAVICIMFVLPMLLLVLATCLLIRGKKVGSIVAGSVLATFSIDYVCIVCAVFSKQLFGEAQTTSILIAVGIAVVCTLLYVLTISAIRRASKPIEPTPPVDTPTDTEQPQVVEQTADEPAPYVPSDSVTVSQVADQTYEQNDVLPPKVLAKLKLARDLYEKGALTKEEYLGIVNKYINQQ